MKPEVWETPSTPLVYGERLVPGATRTFSEPVAHRCTLGRRRQGTIQVFVSADGRDRRHAQRRPERSRHPGPDRA
jgi:hypothetical protein